MNLHSQTNESMRGSVFVGGVLVVVCGWLVDFVVVLAGTAGLLVLLVANPLKYCFIRVFMKRFELASNADKVVRIRMHPMSDSKEP